MSRIIVTAIAGLVVVLAGSTVQAEESSASSCGDSYREMQEKCNPGRILEPNWGSDCMDSIGDVAEDCFTPGNEPEPAEPDRRR